MTENRDKASPEQSGFVKVPVEPTEEMTEAACQLALSRIRRGLSKDYESPGLVEGMKELWRVMVLAAAKEKDQ
jgi:hypothetical protein